jgi:predicted MFS family arabinose efflux permease
LPGLILNGLAFAAFALLTGSLWLYALLWMVFAITQLAIRSTNWNRAASAAFSTSRGLALAIMMLGIPIAQTLAPIVTEALIGEHGWRTGFAAVGIGWTAITFIVCLLLFREPQDRKLPTGQAQAAAAPQGGLSIAEALRNPRMWRIALAILLQSALSTAMTVHLFPLLTESGASRSGAANIVALLGISALAGQIVTGFLADRVKSTVLPVSCFILPVIAYPLLMQGEGSPALLSLGVVLAGFSATATMTMTVYMTTRYAGIHHFGKIYGAISACMGLGSGIGPPLAGAIFDRTGSYDNYLLIGVPVALASGLLVLRLGAYPNFGSSHKATASAGNEED